MLLGGLVDHDGHNYQNNNLTRNTISPLRATWRGGAVLMAGRSLARESRHPPWSTSWWSSAWWLWSPCFSLSEICAKAREAERDGTRMIFPGLIFNANYKLDVVQLCKTLKVRLLHERWLNWSPSGHQVVTNASPSGHHCHPRHVMILKILYILASMLKIYINF